MFRNLRPTLAAALVLTALLPSLASAATYHYRSSGDSATASFYSVDPTGCIWTNTDVYVASNQYRTEPGPSQPATWVSLYIYAYDYCQFTYAYDFHGSTTIPDSGFRVNGGLQSASVQATVDAYNWLTGTFEPVAVDLAWTGEGEVFRGHSNYQSNFPGGRSMARSNGSYRLATPAGSVTLPSTNTNLLANAEYVYGNLSSGQGSYTIILRNN